ncbi:hypothetical protein ACFLXC_04125 [Chloroflexota bacterium]
MSPIALSGIDKQSIDVNGVQTKQSLSATSETVNKGVYDATTLSAVDADLAAANIKGGVTILGIPGTMAGGSLEPDVEGYTVEDDGMDSGAASRYQWRHDLPSSTVVDYITVTQDYNAISLAWAVGWWYGYVSNGNLKTRLYMDGVQMQSVFSPTYNSSNKVVTDFKAMSGNCTCKLSFYGGYSLYLTGYDNVNSKIPMTLAVGSVKGT